MQPISERWRFHWPHLRSIPHHLVRGGNWWINGGAWVVALIAFIVAINQPLGKYLLGNWTGISPWWALSLVFLALLLGLGESYYLRDKDLRAQVIVARAELEKAK